MIIRIEQKRNSYEAYLQSCRSPYKIRWKIREKSRVFAGQLLGFLEEVQHLSDSVSSEKISESSVPPDDVEIPPSLLDDHSITTHAINSPADGRFSRFLGHTDICFEKLQDLGLLNDPNGQQNQDDLFLFQVTEEPCSHSILLQGLCSECGQTVKASNDASNHEASDPFPDSSSFSVTGYISKLGFVSPCTNILVSSEAAKKLEFEKVKSLLLARKLPLILDLDNTLLHAYPFPPPSDVSELLNDLEFRVVKLDDPLLYLPFKPINEAINSSPRNSQPLILPHYDTTFDEEERRKVEYRWESWVISVVSYDTCTVSGGHCNAHSLCLSDQSARSYPCYFKLRPGVIEFLREASKKFELYLFTAGASVHATSSLRVLDPERRWFGTRVFTRKDLPYLESGALGLKTIQRIFPGEASTQNVTVVDDCESVWSPDSNLFKVHAYHWWPDPSLHPFLLLYCRRTPTGAGSHSEIPVKIIDPSAFSRIRAAAFSMLNFCPSIIEMCKSPRRVSCKDVYSLPYAPTSLDGGHSSPSVIQYKDADDGEDSMMVDIEDTISLAKKPETYEPGISQNKEEFSDVAPNHATSQHRQSNDLPPSAVSSSEIVELDDSTKPPPNERSQWKCLTSKRSEENEKTDGPPLKKFCSAWQNKGFERRKKGETQEEMNARVLKVTTKNWKAPNIVKDTDRQLNYLLSILCEMHETFFLQAGELNFETININQLPSVKSILDSMRQKVLRNVILQATGIREASIPDFHDTDLGRSIVALGGQLVAQHHSKPVTHLLVGKETKFYMDALKKDLFPYSAHLMWLEAALFTFQRYDEALFSVDRCEKQYRVFWDALDGEGGEKFSNVPIENEARKGYENKSTLSLLVGEGNEGITEQVHSVSPLQDQISSDHDNVDLEALQRDLLESLD